LDGLKDVTTDKTANYLLSNLISLLTNQIAGKLRVVR
jgi:hypothetical protein